MSSKKRTINHVKNENEVTDEPPSKKQKIDPETHLSLIPRLKQKQMEIRQRLSSFCDGIVDVLRNELAQNEKYEMDVPDPIIFEILSYSNHAQIQQFWMSMEQRLKTFSFMIKPPHTLDEIIEFETKYRQKTNDEKYHIPDALRVSLLLARSIEMPPIFKHLKNSNFDSFLSLFESFILPVNEWKFVYEKSWRHYDILKTIFERHSDCRYYPINERMKETKWFQPGSVKYLQTLCIGRFSDRNLSVEVFMNGSEIIYCLKDYRDYEEPCGYQQLSLCEVDWTKTSQDNDWYTLEDINEYWHPDRDFNCELMQMQWPKQNNRRK